MAYGFLLSNAHSFHQQYAYFNLYLLCFDLKPLVHVSLAMFPQLTLEVADLYTCFTPNL